MRVPKTYVRRLLTGTAVMLIVLAGAPAALTQSEATATAAVATADKAVTHAENDRVPQGAAWTQHYFPSSDGSEVELHADVLLPAGLSTGEQVPVILSVGAYFGHSGQQTLENHAHTGPSNRFNDLIEGTDLFNRGYALVMVDLRGFGGSTGCLDFMAPVSRPMCRPRSTGPRASLDPLVSSACMASPMMPSPV